MPEYNPETILEEQFESQRQQIQKHYQTQWDEVNSRARAGMFKSQKERDSAFFDIRTEATQALDKFDQQTEQATGQLKMVTDLAEQGFIKDPDEVKWRMVLGPEAEKGMFPPEPRDPRDELRELMQTEDRIYRDIGEYVEDDSGRLFYKKRDKKGDYIFPHKPDKDRQVLKSEVEKYIIGMNALDKIEQAKLDVTKQMGAAGIENPYRLENLMRSTEHWAKRAGKWAGKSLVKYSYPGLAYKAYKKIKAEFGTEPTGTFGQKVQRDIAPSLIQQPKTNQIGTPIQTPVQLSQIIDEGPMKFKSPDGKKMYTIPSDRVAEFIEQFPEYEKVR